MNAQRVLDTFLDLVRTDSPSCHEAAVAAYCADALRSCGCTVEFDTGGLEAGSDTGSIYAVLKGTAPGSIILTAHMDCVPPCEGVNPIITDGLIHTDGTTVLGGDDKVGCAAIIEAVRCLTEGDEPYCTVKIILTVQEEVGCCGAKALNVGSFKPGEPCFVFDMDGAPGGVTVGAPYHYTFSAEFIGKASHAGVAPADGINAIAAAAKAIQLMRERGCLGAVGEYAASNVGRIEGGSANNVIAPSCSITGEARAVDPEIALATKEMMQQCMEDGAASEGARVESNWELEYEGFLLTEQDPTVQLAKKAAEACGLPFWTEVSAGGSDANIYTCLGVAPAVVATGMTNFHSVDECLKVKDLEDSAVMAEMLAKVGIKG